MSNYWSVAFSPAYLEIYVVPVSVEMFQRIFVTMLLLLMVPPGITVEGVLGVTKRITAACVTVTPTVVVMLPLVSGLFLLAVSHQGAVLGLALQGHAAVGVVVLPQPAVGLVIERRRRRGT